MKFDFKYSFNSENVECISEKNNLNSYRIYGNVSSNEKNASESIRKILGSSKIDEINNMYKNGLLNNENLIKDIFKNNGKGVDKCILLSYTRALKLLKSQLDDENPLKTVHYNGIAHFNLNKKSSAGLPYTKDSEFYSFIRNRKEKGEIEDAFLTKGNGFDYIFKKEREKIRNIKDELKPIDSFVEDIRVLGRSHISLKTEPDKIRAIYGAPCTILFTEIMLLWPLIARIKDQENPFIAWGYETMRGGLERLRLEVADYSKHISLDFSTFDKLVPFWLIDDIHSLWYDLYEIGSYYRDSDSVIKPFTSKDRIDSLWRFMNYSVKHSTYLAPDGSRYKRKHSGFPSGLLQTQILGSCCAYVMVASALFENGYKESEFSIKVMGDDVCVSIKEKSRGENIITFISEHCKKNFGATLNLEKCVSSEGTGSLQFLSYRFENDKVTRVKKNLLGKILHPISTKFTPGYAKSRAMGILLSNLGSDKDVHNVCTDIIKKLSHVEIDNSRLNFYEQQYIEYYLNNFKDNIPTISQLVSLALTPQKTEKDIYFQAYIIQENIDKTRKSNTSNDIKSKRIKLSKL